MGPVFWTFGLKAWGFLERMLFLAFLICSMLSGLLWHPWQLHLSSQYLPWVKHSQYILRHFDLEHLQVRCSTVVLFYFIMVNWVSWLIVDCLWRVFLPRPRVFLLAEEVGVTADCWPETLRMESTPEEVLDKLALRLFFWSLFLSVVFSLNCPVPSLSILKNNLKISNLHLNTFSFSNGAHLRLPIELLYHHRLIIIIIWITANLIVQINGYIYWLNISDISGRTVSIRWSWA